MGTEQTGAERAHGRGAEIQDDVYEVAHDAG